MTGFDNGPINAVVIGTPHAPLWGVGRLAELIEGRRMKGEMPFSIQMNRFVLEGAREKEWGATLTRCWKHEPA